MLGSASESASISSNEPTPNPKTNLKPHQIGQLVDDNLSVLAGVFVDPFDVPPLPVGPVDVVAQLGEPEYMGQVLDE